MKDDCKFKGVCTRCNDNRDSNSCVDCKHYRPIDSGYGYCKVGPPIRLRIGFLLQKITYDYPLVPQCLSCCDSYKEREG